MTHSVIVIIEAPHQPMVCTVSRSQRTVQVASKRPANPARPIASVRGDFALYSPTIRVCVCHDVHRMLPHLPATLSRAAVVVAKYSMSAIYKRLVAKASFERLVMDRVAGMQAKVGTVADQLIQQIRPGSFQINVQRRTDVRQDTAVLASPKPR